MLQINICYFDIDGTIDTSSLSGCTGKKGLSDCSIYGSVMATCYVSFPLLVSV